MGVDKHGRPIINAPSRYALESEVMESRKRIAALEAALEELMRAFPLLTEPSVRMAALRKAKEVLRGN